MKAVRRSFLVIFAVAALLMGFAPAEANHSWGPYHWARTSNPFTLKVVNSVTSNWDGYLATAQSDWAQSTVLNLTSEQGDETSNSRKRCNGISGKIRVCNQTYGFNGWLGIASISITTGNHIAAGTTKLNDSYFNTSTYNTPAWHQFVTCQEVGHDFGLDHQDENFNNANLGTCMDYTNDPSTNQHDYDQLVTIYSHTDSFNSYTAASIPLSTPATAQISVQRSVDENGVLTITWILWADPEVTRAGLLQSPLV